MLWFRNLSTAAKLMIGFAVVGLLIAAVGGMAVFNMSAINTSAEQIYDAEMLPSLLLAKMSSLTHEQRSDLYHALAAKDPGEIGKKLNAGNQRRKCVTRPGAWDTRNPRC